ncbi:MAG: CHAT domain-containing protein [Acidobacteria bacterium]|nr:CHAT domain-containing protein [Acidobacteriota bacterium]
MLTRAASIASVCKGLAGTPDEGLRARILLGEVAIAQRRYPACIRELEAEQVATKDALLEVRRAIALGLAKLRSGQPAEARQLLYPALENARQMNSHELAAETLVRMSFPELKAAERGNYLDQALAHARLTHDPALESQITGALGYWELDQEHPTAALRWFEQSLTLARRAGAMGWQEKTLGNMGEAHYQLGNFELSIEYLHQAAELAGRIGNHEDQVRWLNLLGNYQNLHGRPNAARPYYSTALLLARQHHTGLAQTLNNLSNVAVQIDDIAVAWRYHKDAAEARQTAKLPPVPDFNRGYLLAKERRWDEAIAQFRDIATSPDARPATRRQALISLADACYSAGRRKEAFAGAELLLDDIREERSRVKQLSVALSIQSLTARFYREYVRMLLAENRDMDALLIVEEARGGTRQTAEALMQIAARRNAVILDYWPGERMSAVWVITASGIVRKPIPKESALRELLREHESQLNAGRRTEPEYLTAGQKLHQALVGESLGNRRVIVIADDVLGRLNWETLVAGPKPHFWLEDVVVSRAFSIASLAAREPEPASDALLIYGNPDLPAAKYPALLRAEEEIRRVQAVYRPGRTTVVDHQRAEAAAFASHRPEQFGYIHFVTHGEASLRSPLESALIFSGQPESRLTALSVAQRPMNAKLVTLSACHSAGIKAYRGAGLVGMGWAFLHAGAQSVIAGLWEVNDGASARLHPSLYARIAKGASPAEALREAKRELLGSDTNFRKPYYWGAWVLFEGRP